MEFGVNYSPMLAELVQAGQVQVDRYKCPAWPGLLQEAAASLPVYVHCPLVVGRGQGGPLDTERKRPAELDFFAGLVEATSTPLINTHYYPTMADVQGIPQASLHSEHARRMVDQAVRDLEPLIRRFGAERVLVENCIPDESHPALLAAPEVLHAILEETGCGFLFDVSHARLSAIELGLDERDYITSLPVERIREVHVTGIQRIEGRWVEMMRAANDPSWNATNMEGILQDHLPMTDEDWTAYEWVMDRLHADGWGQPWVVACEYGGVGGFWDLSCDREVYLRDLPRLRAAVKTDEESPRG